MNITFYIILNGPDRKGRKAAEKNFSKGLAVNKTFGTILNSDKKGEVK